MTSIKELLAVRQNKILVFTNGVFDILHAGHVRYLASARNLGDMLVVGVNTDDSVKRLGKGANRPVNRLADRAEVLEALRAVDAVIPFAQDTPIDLIRALMPDIHVKGGDYTIESLPEAPVVLAYGGKVVILPTLEGRSTTGTLQRLGAE